MMARRTFGSGVLGGLAMLALSGCKLLGSSRTYRYRMTVEVETPQGLKTGSAVREIVYTEQMIKLPDAAAVTATQRGEAVVVDLPNGQALFALLSTNGYETLQAAFGDDSPATLNAAQNDERLVELRPKPNSIPEQSGYPTLVTFSDVADPSSLKLVDPIHLSAIFGSGTRLKRIVLEITDDAVTTGIVKQLGWLDQLDRFRTDAKNPFTNTLPKEISKLRVQ